MQLAASAALVGARRMLARIANAAGPRTLKIGYVSPQTGPLAPFGEADRFTIQQMQTALKSGITIGGKQYPVSILVKDSQSNPNRAGEVANDLILKDKVDIMLVSGTPETANPVSDACEVNEMPCVSTVVPWQPWFFGRKGDPKKGFNYTYHFFWGLEDVIAVYTGMWQSVQTNKAVGGLFPERRRRQRMGRQQARLSAGARAKGLHAEGPRPLPDDDAGLLRADFRVQARRLRRS